MGLLYSMIKKVNTTTAAEKNHSLKVVQVAVMDLLEEVAQVLVVRRG